MPSLERLILDENWLRRAGAILAYLAATILIAYWIGTFQILYLYLVIQLAILGYLILWAQRRAWILILLGWSLTSATAFFKIPISVRDFSVLASFCAYVVFRVASGTSMSQRWRLVDAIVALTAMYLAFTFVLNPVGFNTFGAQRIGARPYFTAGLAVMGYWVIWRLPNSIKTVSHIPLFILAGSAVVTSLYVMSYLFPSLPSRIPYLYAALDVQAYFGGAQIMREERLGGGIVRYQQLGFFGLMLMTTLYAYFPSLALLNPLRPRFYALLVGTVCMLLSGFRGIFGAACCLFGIAVWLNGKFGRFLAVAVIGGGLLLGIVAGQGRLYDLPLSAQRTLAFLPGRWDPVVALDAQASTEGRFKWWRQVFEENLIQNWWFGDGFGASVGDVELASRSGTGELAFVTGGLHNGPLTAARYVGVIGLVLFYALMIVNAVDAWRCAQRCKGTLLQPVAIYLAIQLVWIPINYTLIFGAYDSDMPQQIFLAALLRLVMRMADKLPQPTPAVPASIVEMRPPALALRGQLG